MARGGTGRVTYDGPDSGPPVRELYYPDMSDQFFEVVLMTIGEGHRLDNLNEEK